MVGHLMLLKILHCRRTRELDQKDKRSSLDDIKTEPGSSGITVKQESVDENLTCRVCLKDGNIPIFGSNGKDDVSEALRSFGDIDIYTDDDYPKYLCQSCHDLLQGAILFRKTAKQSDEQLRNPYQLMSESDKFNDSDDNLSEEDDPKDCIYKVTRDRKKKTVYKCKRCSLDFDRYEDYSDHRLSQEHENKRHVCHICHKSYTSLYFKKHMVLHERDKSYMCDICGKEFAVQGHFSRHRLTHFYDLPFKCSLCPYRGRFTESLKLHMRSHTGEKPYQCEECSAKFVSKSNLNKHMMTHKGDHNFKCEFCPRGFYTKRNLELHFKVDHTGIKDHVCNICGKAFGYRKQMMKHQLKVHKRQKLRSGRLPLYLQVQAKEQQDFSVL